MNRNLPSLTPAASLDGTEVYYAVQNGADVKVPGSAIAGAYVPAAPLILATSNLTFYVNPSTGSDTLNLGTTVGHPFKTLAQAITTAARYNYANLYSPTIILADGTYSNTAVTLPPLVNSVLAGVITGNNSTPANVKLDDGGATWTILCQSFSNWAISGVNFTGSYGGIDLLIFSAFTITGSVVFSGSLPHGCMSSAGFLSAPSVSFSITASTIGTFYFSGYIGNLDSATITFANAVSFTGPVIALDDRLGFLGLDGASFVNPSNVSISSGPCLTVTNGAYLEANAGTLSGGATLTRANFPGFAAGFTIDGNSIFQPDGAFVSVSSGGYAWSSNGLGTGSIDTALWRVLPGTVVVSSALGALTGGVLGSASILGTGAAGGIGYFSPSLGVGGTVVQASSKSTGVALNNPTGQITLNNAALAGNTTVSFTLTDSAIAATDLLVLNHISGGTAGSYSLNAQCASGGASINVRNITSGSLSEAIVISFALIKGAVN